MLNSVNTLHLEPRTYPMQSVIGTIIRILPATRLRRFVDLFGNIAHHFDIGTQHRKLSIESMVKVHNLTLEISEKGKTAGIEELEGADLHGFAWQFLQESRWISLSPEIWKQAIDLTHDDKAVYAKAVAIMEWINREFTYAPGSTDVSTHLETVFSSKQGVCQDFTHVMIGLCRSVGIPARYVSGYLYNGPKDTLIGAQASHAWCEVFLPGDGWIGFDPTNCNLADERYIKIAVGRDYEDVAPVRGSYYGSANCRMEIDVTVARL